LRDNDFQLVFLDIGLPDMDGYEVARRLTLLGRRGSLSIVAVSGYDSDEDLRRSDGAGLDAHLVKPCRGDQLEEILLNAMAVRHQAASSHASLRQGLSVRGYPVRPRTARL
jgi:CheY-like chemotaxis protein